MAVELSVMGTGFASSGLLITPMTPGSSNTRVWFDEVRNDSTTIMGSGLLLALKKIRQRQ